MKIGIRQSEIENLLEGFALDLSEKEPAVFTHETNDGVKLTVYELSVVTDDCNADNCDGFAVLMIDFCDRDIESALKTTHKALDDTSFALERGYPL